MRHEKIYEIPVNEAFDLDCECPVCALEHNLEEKNVEFCIGPAMMKPEFRIRTNETGFCRRHLRLMLKKQNKLPLALVLDTHFNTVSKSINRTKGKKKLPDIDAVIQDIGNFKDKCVVCENVEDVLRKHIDVILYMWLANEEFKEKLLNCKGFCLKHFYQLLTTAKKEMSKKQANEFCETIINIECIEFSRVNEDINWFTKKFDYKNSDADWKNSKDAPFRSAAKLWGYIDD